MLNGFRDRPVQPLRHLSEMPVLSVALAEREGFEPSEPGGSHDFQSCRFSHSRTSPRLRGQQYSTGPGENQHNGPGSVPGIGHRSESALFGEKTAQERPAGFCKDTAYDLDLLPVRIAVEQSGRRGNRSRPRIGSTEYESVQTGQQQGP